MENPWSVSEISAFSYFCCPECDYKSQSENTFVEHAAQNHPDAKDFCQLQIKFEDDLKENLEIEGMLLCPAQTILWSILGQF